MLSNVYFSFSKPEHEQGIHFAVGSGQATEKAENSVFRVPTPVNEFAQKQQKKKKLKIGRTIELLAMTIFLFF